MVRPRKKGETSASAAPAGPLVRRHASISASCCMRADRTQSPDTATRHSDDNKQDSSANSPPPARRVPNEILLTIIGHLAGDQSSLAKCMRVSSDVNAMAAPLLYHNVSWSWDSEHGYPLVRPACSKRLARETRITATKQENL
jgi:hypothetical protein